MEYRFDTIGGESCSGCFACYNICPKHCIIMKEDDEGFIRPHVDESKCLKCGMCVNVCPIWKKHSSHDPLSVWAAYCYDEELRQNSSSGGIFSLLALQSLKFEGKVFGAAFSDDYKEVYHLAIENTYDLEKLRTSKYIQSVVGNTFAEVKKLLDNGIQVLFSGVPCQIAGLKCFLGKEYDNLLCVDVICHGVPSPELWKKYLCFLENRYNGVVSDVNFRHKKLSGEKFTMHMESEGVDIFNSHASNPYMAMFLRNYCLRPSCYMCQAKINGSDADITLGDFWGINNVAPEMNDGMGTSVIIVHTSKGANWLGKIGGAIIKKEVPYLSVKKYNSSIHKSVQKPIERLDFFYDMRKMDFDELAEKYCSIRTKATLKEMISQGFLGKLLRIVLRGKKTRGIGNTLEYGLYIKLKNRVKDGENVTF